MQFKRGDIFTHRTGPDVAVDMLLSSSSIILMVHDSLVSRIPSSLRD
jgi:hypothetical protein